MTRIEQLQQLLLTAPNDCFLKHAQALECIKINDLDKARQLFEENLAFDPGYVATYYHLGQLLEKLGLPVEALVTYRQGMEWAKTLGDEHTYGELRSVEEELLF